MAKIERFEDIQSWQKARKLANLVYKLTNKDNFAKDFELRNQIRRVSGSVLHNIAEGFDAGSNPEFIRFLKMHVVRPAKCSHSCTWPSISN